MASMPCVKVYGERNTGTNYFVSLLEKNFRARVLPGTAPRAVSRVARLVSRTHRRLRGRTLPAAGERLKDQWFATAFPRTLGWKHMRVLAAPELARYALARETRFVTLTKNPYAWLLSLHRRPYHAEDPVSGDFLSFLGRPWPTVARDHCAKTLASPVDLWNLKNASYLGLTDGGFAVVNLRYEDLLADPAAAVGRVHDLGVEWLHDGAFENVEASSKGDKGRDFSYYRDFYLEERWRDRLTPETVAVINERLDADVVRHFGYDVLDPDEIRDAPRPDGSGAEAVKGA